MRVTLDLDKLLKEGEITKTEYEKLKKFALKDIGTLAYNILIGFGVIAVCAGLLALLKSDMVSMLLLDYACF